MYVDIDGLFVAMLGIAAISGMFGFAAGYIKGAERRKRRNAKRAGRE